jgi:hypothetical protein
MGAYERGLLVALRLSLFVARVSYYRVIRPINHHGNTRPHGGPWVYFFIFLVKKNEFINSWYTLRMNSLSPQGVLQIYDYLVQQERLDYLSSDDQIALMDSATRAIQELTAKKVLAQKNQEKLEKLYSDAADRYQAAKSLFEQQK